MTFRPTIKKTFLQKNIANLHQDFHLFQVFKKDRTLQLTLANSNSEQRQSDH